MRNRMRRPRFYAAVLIFSLFTLITPLLHANDLRICQASDSKTTLQNQVFAFDVTGGNLSGTAKVFVHVGQCVFVAHGANLIYTITEEGSSNSTLSSVTANGNDNGFAANGLLVPWVFPSRTVVAKVFTGITYVHFVNTEKIGIHGSFVGGGNGVSAIHTFDLHCNPAANPTNKLEVKFMDTSSQPHSFRLTSLTSTTCYVDKTGSAVILGSGIGEDTVTHSGGGTTTSGGYGVQFVFTDASQPGTHDLSSYTITTPSNSTVLSSGGVLPLGTQIFHPQP